MNTNNYDWDLTHIYKNEEELESAINKFKTFLNYYDEYYNFYYNLSSYTPEQIAIQIEKFSDISTEYNKIGHDIYTYANLLFDQDTSNSKSVELKGRIELLFDEIGSKFSFISSKTAELPLETLEFLRDYDYKNERKNKRNKLQYENLINQKKHILSDKEEKVLSEIYNPSFGDIRTILTSSDINFETIILESGEKINVNDSTYGLYMKSKNRNDRKLIYESYWKSFKQIENTLYKLMYEKILSSVKIMKLRNYNNSLEKSLLPDIPIEIYHSLIKYTRDNINLYHDYLKLKKDKLGYDNLYVYDLRCPIINNVDFNIELEEAKTNILNANKKYLGEYITNIIEEAFNNKWIDYYQKDNKVSGAYMNGSSSKHPYILLNYIPNYDGMSTLSHELGHAIHTYLSNKEQDFEDKDYATFIAEIASITNETCLRNYILDNETDKDKKIFLINEFVTDFISTVYRQVMLAEYELWLYEEVENGTVLSKDILNNKYKELITFYYGVDKGILKLEDLNSIGWMNINHFYYGFYVFQYSTSFIGSLIAFDNIKKGITEPFINLLKSGSSDRPLNLLKEANIDLVNRESYDSAFKMFEENINYLKQNL